MNLHRSEVVVISDCNFLLIKEITPVINDFPRIDDSLESTYCHVVQTIRELVNISREISLVYNV